MKIVEVCPYDMDRAGGVQANIRDLAAWLEANGHPVKIVAPPAASGRAVPGVRHAGRMRTITAHGTLTELCSMTPAQSRALGAELTAWGADILHLHTPWTPLLPWQVWRRTGLPAAATFHATLPREGAGLLGTGLRVVARYFMRRLDAVIVPSISPLENFPSANREAAHVLPPTVDLLPWFAAGREAPRSESTAKSIVFLGRLEKRKGVDVLIDAWRRLAGRLPGTVLTIAGGGAMEPLVQGALSAPGGEMLRFIREPSAKDARKLVAGADLFIAPSPFGESFGIVLIEAMAAGTVPVAAANSGYSTVLTGPGAELLVPTGDAAALAARIEALVLDGEARRRLRAWGLGHAADFDVRVVGPRYLALFESILRERAA